MEFVVHMLFALRSWSWRPAKLAVVVVSMVVLLAPSGDALRFNPAQEAAAAYSYDLVSWHLSNIFTKWTRRAFRFLPWNGLSDTEEADILTEYFALGEQVARLRIQIRQLSTAGPDGPDASKLEALEEELETVRDIRRDFRPDAEETIESAISHVAGELDLRVLGKFVFPPVDFRLTEPPKIVVTSPRDRIERIDDALVDPHVTLNERGAIERGLLEDDNLAGIVLDIGGVATYPASVNDARGLRDTLQTAAHEWLHHHFFFKSLGQNMFDTAEMQTINETVANIAGDEIGDMAFEHLRAQLDGRALNAHGGNVAEAVDMRGGEAGGFDFNREMRRTRLRVDELLALGEIDEAEAYMERRRQLFVSNGYLIRKLNQAFFAFNGTYAENSASASPIGAQLRRLRELEPDLGAFIKTMADVGSYQEFLDTLYERERLVLETAEV